MYVKVRVIVDTFLNILIAFNSQFTSNNLAFILYKSLILNKTKNQCQIVGINLFNKYHIDIGRSKYLFNRIRPGISLLLNLLSITKKNDFEQCSLL